MASVDLSDFLGHLGDAIKTVRDGCAQANIMTLEDYLEKAEGEDFFRFRTICIKAGAEIIDVPLYGLTPQGHLDLDTIEVEFDTVVSLNPHSKKDFEDKSGNPKFSITMSRGMLTRSSEMRVKATFCLKEGCESTEQIRDKINKLIPISRYHQESNNG